MGKSRLKISSQPEFRPTVVSDRRKQTDVSLGEFFQWHEKFLSLKALEGLASRTLRDHKNHMQYFKRYIEEQHRSPSDRCVDIDVLRGYITYMAHEKEFKQCTVNVRLRTLKCYLRWLNEEEYIAVDYSKKLKLLKVPEDTIRPLSDADVRKMLRMPDKKGYAGYRDFALMVLMLDCGVRINEALHVQVEDVDLKVGLLNIRPENAKTRTFRQVPISKKTCRLLGDFVKIAKENGCRYIFQSSLGGKASKDNIIHHFVEYGRKAGITQRCTPHVWRHTFARNFVKARGDIFTLQRILGHSTLEMCRKYIQLENTDLIEKHKEAGLLDNYLV